MIFDVQKKNFRVHLPSFPDWDINDIFIWSCRDGNPNLFSNLSKFSINKRLKTIFALLVRVNSLSILILKSECIDKCDTFDNKN